MVSKPEIGFRIPWIVVCRRNFPVKAPKNKFQIPTELWVLEFGACPPA
jgi:hypothetical protein